MRKIIVYHTSPHNRVVSVEYLSLAPELGTLNTHISNFEWVHLLVVRTMLIKSRGKYKS
jgi:hypothetical protein